MASEQTTTPTSSPSKSERDATVDAVNHLIQGKRHLLVRDISSAVDSLQEACRILAACYGEMADECGDAYFHYGSALLELSRKESGILGNEKADSGSEEEESEEENEDDEDEEASGDDDEGDKSSEKNDQDSSKGTTKEASKMGGTVETDREMTKAGAIVDKVETKSSPSKEESKITPTKDDSEAKSEDLDTSKKADENVLPEETSDASAKDTPKSDSSAQISTSAGASTSADSSQPGTSQDKSGSEDDDVTTLQLSWEILELSKVIFKRQSESNREMQLRLAQVHLKLGEVAMESENYKQSIEDLLECFKIQHALLPADDRSIAEVYYQLGLAYTFDLQFDLAIESFKNAVQTLRDRISNIQKIAGNGTSEKDVDAAYNAKKEIEELNELLPEILEKITDTEYLKNHDLKLPEELNKDLVPEQFKTEIVAVDSTTGTVSSPSKIPKPVSSIAHLVRKKRKPEEDDVSTSACSTTESKRSRTCIDELGRTNPVTDSSSDTGSKINGITQMECCQIGDTDKFIESSTISQSNTSATSI